jgi:COMPASS component SPP1
MNPYEADPAKIPAPDLYADVPLFGRYSPREDDLQPNAKYFMSTSPESVEYWSSVLDLCDASTRMVEGLEGGREVFALGSIVVKSSHITRDQQGRRSRRDHSFGDVNEVAASSLAREAIPDIRIPRIYFAGKVSLLLQKRISMGLIF